MWRQPDGPLLWTNLLAERRPFLRQMRLFRLSLQAVMADIKANSIRHCQHQRYRERIAACQPSVSKLLSKKVTAYTAPAAQHLLNPWQLDCAPLLIHVRKTTEEAAASQDYVSPEKGCPLIPLIHANRNRQSRGGRCRAASADRNLPAPLHSRPFALFAGTSPSRHSRADVLTPPQKMPPPIKRSPGEGARLPRQRS